MVKNLFLKLLVAGIGFTGILNATVLTTEKPTLKTNVPSMDEREKSLQAFGTVLKVIKSPRCINCHPSNDRPRQGDDHHEHLFGVTRGAANHGGLVQKCSTCHQSENNGYTNVPGAPHWGLAPKSMGWVGLSDIEIANALMDKNKNGGRSAADLVAHMSNDSLVLWAWNPGPGRTLPPVPLEQFRNALNEWLANGAHVPEQPKASN